MKRLIIAIALAFIITGCNSTENSDPIRIGALFPLTGGLATYGEAAMTSAQMAAEEINAQGGINGRLVEIDFQDHQCDPKVGLTAFDQLRFAKNIKIFTSAACSGTVLAIAPTIKGKDAILVGTIVTTPKITGVSPNIFRNWASDAKQAKLYADVIKEKGYKSVGILHEQTDYAAGLRTSLEKHLSDTEIAIDAESFEPGSSDVRTQLTKLKEKKDEVIFLSPQTETSGDVILKQMQELRFRPRVLIVNDNILKMPSLMERYKETLEGALSADYVFEETKKHQEFLEKYRKRYNKDCTHTNICAGAYDAIHLLAKAIKEKGENTNELRHYLSTTQYSGVSGTFGFDENNDRTNAQYSLFVARNGKAVKKSEN